MKYKNYLVRVPEVLGRFSLARGEEIGNGLAVVKVYQNLNPVNNTWRIIDILSGLHVLNPFNSSKKKALERFYKKLEDSNSHLMNEIIKAREKPNYAHRVVELNNEKKLWRESGYEID